MYESATFSSASSTPSRSTTSRCSTSQPNVSLVVVDRGFEVAHRDGDVVDLGQQHAASSGTGADCRVGPMERARRAAIAAALILGAALLVAFGRTIFGSWHSTGDHAVIELRTLDVGGRHTPLVGPYSRYGWSHPGPALFYALAPVLRLFAKRDIGTLAGAVVLNGLALGCIFAVLWRRRDAVALVAGVFVAAVLVRAMGGAGLLDPWNPYVIVLPLLACVICAWAAAGGSRWSLVATVVLASFVAQTHIGAAPAAIALVLFAFGWVVADAVRARGADRRRRVTTMAIAAGAGVVAWLPPVVQALTSDGGNLRAIWEFWTGSHAVSGWAQGARLVGPQFAIPAPWMGAHEKISLGGALDPSANRFPVALILLAVVTVLAARRRDRDALVLCSLAWRARARDLDRGVAPRGPAVRVPPAVGVGGGRGHLARGAVHGVAAAARAVAPDARRGPRGRSGRRVRAGGARRGERGPRAVPGGPRVARARARARAGARDRCATRPGRSCSTRGRRCARRAPRSACCSTPGTTASTRGSRRRSRHASNGSARSGTGRRPPCSSRATTTSRQRCGTRPTG